MAKFTDHDFQTGITTTVHELDGKTVFQKTYDGQQFRDAAAEMRANTDGEKWGEMRHVGTVPIAELATMMRQDGGIDQRRLVAWLKANPALVTFNRFLK